MVGKDGDRRTSKKVLEIKQAREACSMEGGGSRGAGEKQVASTANPMCPVYADAAKGIRWWAEKNKGVQDDSKLLA